MHFYHRPAATDKFLCQSWQNNNRIIFTEQYQITSGVTRCSYHLLFGENPFKNPIQKTVCTHTRIAKNTSSHIKSCLENLFVSSINTFDRPQSKPDSKHVVKIATKDTENAITNPNCSCLINLIAIYVNEVKVVSIRLDSVAKFIAHTDLPHKAREIYVSRACGPRHKISMTYEPLETFDIKLYMPCFAAAESWK